MFGYVFVCHPFRFPLNPIVFYTQHLQGLTGKDKILDSLVGPIVNLVIARNIMVYCIEVTWVVGTGSEIFRGHMVF